MGICKSTYTSTRILGRYQFDQNLQVIAVKDTLYITRTHKITINVIDVVGSLTAARYSYP